VKPAGADSLPELAREGGGAFSFVQALAAELSRGHPELPAFPVVVMRIQQTLKDNNADLGRIVRLIGSEPVIAAQVMRMASSAALNPSRSAVPDLRAAIARVGLDAVRTAAITFAMRQLRDAPALRGLAKPLGALWQRSVQMASLCYVIAQRFTRINPDAAMLAGLLQGVGRLYILARASQHPELFADDQVYRSIEKTWHLGIATALLENWGIAPEIVQAVRDSEDFECDTRGRTLADVLMVATLLTQFDGEPGTLQSQVQSAPPCQRLQLDYGACEAFLKESAHEIASLRETLASS